MKSFFKIIFAAAMLSVAMGVVGQTEGAMAGSECPRGCEDINSGDRTFKDYLPKGDNIVTTEEGPMPWPVGGTEWAADSLTGELVPSKAWVDSAGGLGMVMLYTTIETRPDGSQRVMVTAVHVDCENPIDPWQNVKEIPAPEISKEDGGGEEGGKLPTGCPCGDNVDDPGPEARPPDAEERANQDDGGYATAAAYVNGARSSTFNADDLASRNPDGTYNMVALTPEQAALMRQGGEETVVAVAKPRDNMAIRTAAKGAYISGHTTDSYAKVTNDLNTGGDDGEAEELEDVSGGAITLDRGERVAVAADVGKVFTGTAEARPLRAHLTWSPIYGSYIRGHTPNAGSCSYEYDCGSSCDGWDDLGNCTGWSTDYCSRSCSYIASWTPVMGSYVADRSPNYSQSGEASKKAHIIVPYSYNVEIPPMVACDVPGAPPCGEDITHPGEDRQFLHSVKINAGDSGYATNTRPSTYEIVSFVIAPDSVPGGAGIGAFRASAPGASDTCEHYITGTTPARSDDGRTRGCVVVQQGTGVHFNTNGGVNLGGTTDTSAYGIAGDFPESLNPTIVVDDMPAGSKICVALSVWPSGYSGLDSEFNGVRGFSGGNWLHGAPYCLTIAKKPSTQFWGAGVFSAGGITTSQSIKYVLSSNGFVAGGDHNGISSKDDNRRAFGSWSEYEAIAGGSIKGLATGAALGYNPLDTTTGGNFNSTRPGGFPTNYSAGYDFTKERLCSYSSQTFANANSTNAECRADATAMGNSNIASNIELTLNRLISRYSTTTEVGNAPAAGTITIGSDSPQSISPDGVVKNYSSSSSDVTLETNGANIPAGSTITISVPGKLTIADDIKYEDASGHTNIADLPQVLIFADNIDILPGVSRVDAWLVVGQVSKLRGPGAAYGVLNTCSGFSVGTSGINACDDDTLVVNGPVFAKKLELNRTAGAGAGYESITPAERFNLRADAYLWSYAQAQRYSQAVVTYSRELAPRY